LVMIGKDQHEYSYIQNAVNLFNFLVDIDGKIIGSTLE